MYVSYNMWERVHNSRMISVIVNGEEYEEFKKLLPNGKTFGEYIRKVMREEIELQKKEEALSSPNYSPIGQCNNNIDSTLDKYFPNHIMEWENFKVVIEDELDDEERKTLTEIWLHNFRILEMTNYNRTGTKVFPLLRI